MPVLRKARISASPNQRFKAFEGPYLKFPIAGGRGFSSSVAAKGHGPFTSDEEKFAKIDRFKSITCRHPPSRNALIPKNACYLANRKNLVASIGVRGH